VVGALLVQDGLVRLGDAAALLLADGHPIVVLKPGEGVKAAT
jgi:hypothetical protein